MGTPLGPKYILHIGGPKQAICTGLPGCAARLVHKTIAGARQTTREDATISAL